MLTSNSFSSRFPSFDEPYWATSRRFPVTSGDNRIGRKSLQRQLLHPTTAQQDLCVHGIADYATRARTLQDRAPIGHPEVEHKSPKRLLVSSFRPQKRRHVNMHPYKDRKRFFISLSTSLSLTRTLEADFKDHVDKNITEESLALDAAAALVAAQRPPWH